MELVLFEENKPLLLEALRQGDFDYIEAAGEVFEADFFRFLKVKALLDELAQTCPTPRKKEDVPLWLYVASNLSMRLHGVHSFHAFPLVVRAGGMLSALGPKVGRKVPHPKTGEVTVACEGFNKKNHYDRQTPCDQDFLRKVAKDTEAEALLRWLNQDVARVFRKRRAFDLEGIFIGDASYLFVPDNPNYEGSVKMLFDPHHHPVSSEQYAQMTAEQKSRCQWRRCYKMVTLLHTNRAWEFFLFVAVKVVSGKDHECPILYALVKQFVEAVGPGVIKRLILDRGFLDGQAISLCKKEYGIDILIPVRRNMDIYEDALALFGLPEVSWVDCPAPPQEVPKPVAARPAVLVQREKERQKRLRQRQQQQPPPPPENTLVKREVAAIGEFQTWSSCTVPLSVVAHREIYADGHVEYWVLLDTAPIRDPGRTRQEYGLRPTIEERHRQLKCFSDLESFTSRAFTLIVHQVVFVLLTYRLLQWFLLRLGRKELNPKTRTRTLELLRPTLTVVVIYYQNYMAFLTPLQHQELVLTLSEPARKKILAKTRRLRRSLAHQLDHARPP